MTLEQARLQNLDVFLLPETRRDLIENLLAVFSERAVEFPVVVEKFPMTAVAVKRLPGLIAAEMKKRKHATV